MTPRDMRFTARLVALVLVLGAVPRPTRLRAETVDELLAAATDLYAHQRWADACEKFAQLLAAAPDDPRAVAARFYFGEALSQARRYAEAQRQFAEMLQRDPDGRYACQALFRAAEAAYLAGDRATAKRDLAAFHERYADDALNRFVLPYLGDIALEAGDVKTAQQCFAEALDRFTAGPLAEDCRLGLAECLERQGELDGARKGYAALADAGGPLADQALAHLSILENEAGSDAQALAAFDRLAHDFPDSPYAADAALRLAERAIAREQFDDARKLLAAVPDRHEAIEKVDSAAAELHQRKWYLQGQLGIAQSHWSQAEASLEKLIKAYPKGSLALPSAFLLGEVAFRQGLYHQAAERLADVAAKAQGDEPWLATAELRRAQSLAQLKEWDEALALARSIEKRFPNFDSQAEADYLAGRCLAAQAEFEQAREAYGKAIEASHGRNSETAAMAQCMTGESYFHQEEFAAALAQYRKVEQYPYPRWQAAALVQAGKCHELLGHPRDAVEAYRRLIKEFPDSPFAAEATRRLAAAEKEVAGRP